MYRKEAVLQGESGLHARPASIFVEESSQYISEIMIIKNDQEYNAKSIMGVLSMGGTKGDELVIKAEGKDEKEAVEALVHLIENESKEL
ncbi:MAG TPA: HPr family phosphocarrier protein [Tissierellaceae bacterium]|nr:HPr family phosphocarrier protein [Tissierellaceae bacterium]